MGGRGADEEEEPRIYLPEMATGTVMWNVYGGLYVEADLYASRWRERERGMDPHIGAVVLHSRDYRAARSRAPDPFNFTRHSAKFPALHLRDLFVNASSTKTFEKLAPTIRINHPRCLAPRSIRNFVNLKACKFVFF